MTDQTRVAQRASDLSKVPHLTLDASKHVPAKILPASGGGGGGSELMFFGRIAPDAASGRNVLTISGLPSNTRVATVWMTEWVEGDSSHVGAAVFYTESVQLEASDGTCRVVFYNDWDNSLPAAAMCVFGLFEGDVNIDA